MNRILIAIAAAVFAVSTMHVPAAQAGFKGKVGIGLLAIGALHAMSKHRHHERRRHRRRHRAHRRARHKTYVTRKKSVEEAPKVAKLPAPIPELPVQKTAINENSSISTAALPAPEETAVEKTVEASENSTTVKVAAENAETAAADEPKAPQRLDCKKFFPTVGMTLSVPCE